MAAVSERLKERLTGGALDSEAPARDPVPTRSVERRLRVEAVVDLIDDHLEVTLRLHVAPHHAERADGTVSFGQERGDDGVEGPLSGREDVRLRLVQREAVASVLDGDPRTGDDNTAAEPLVV